MGRRFNVLEEDLVYRKKVQVIWEEGSGDMGRKGSILKRRVRDTQIPKTSGKVCIFATNGNCVCVPSSSIADA